MNDLWSMLSAVGTLAAVAVALWLPEIRGLWHGAALTVRVGHGPADCQLVGPHHYLRLWVENTGGQAAENVQAFADELQTVSGEFNPDAIFLPMNLRWTHEGGSGSTPS